MKEKVCGKLRFGKERIEGVPIHDYNGTKGGIIYG